MIRVNRDEVIMAMYAESHDQQRILVQEDTKPLAPVRCEHNKHNNGFTGRCPICGVLNLPKRLMVTQYYSDGTIKQGELIISSKY